jgi:hypothetical protein
VAAPTKKLIKKTEEADLCDTDNQSEYKDREELEGTYASKDTKDSNGLEDPADSKRAEHPEDAEGPEDPEGPGDQEKKTKSTRLIQTNRFIPMIQSPPITGHGRDQ